MQLSKLIKQLQHAEEKYGNLDVVVRQGGIRLQRNMYEFYAVYTEFGNASEITLQDVPVK